MRFITLVFIFALSTACGTSEKKDDDQETKGTEHVKDAGYDTLGLTVFDFEGLKPLLEQKDERIHVVNFWATWCEPCIKELPYFEQITAEYRPSEVEVLLVNLDMPTMWGPRLIPYIEKQGLRSKVVILDDPKQNSWIPQVAQEWSGAIPATVIYTKDKRKFYERQFSADELRAELQKFLKR